MFRLDSSKALVTGVGSASGIGFAAAKALKELGAEVFITSTSDRIYIRAEELGVKGFIADLTKESDVQALESKISNLDILVNNAGMTSVTSPASEAEATDISQLSLEALRVGMSRNLETAFLATKYFLPKIRQSKSGRIIMISSLTGHVMVMKNQPVYATAKAALVGLTKSIALDEAKYGITCNAVLPGWIATDTQGAHEQLQGMKTPLGRSGKPSEIAGLVNWLASDTSGYLTGQALVVDGGNSIAEERS